jgi:AMMECR1 domain-containing protein
VSGEPEACRIAIHALASYFRAGSVWFGPDIVPAGLQAPAAAWVAIWTGDELRGCMGSLRPVMPSAAGEIALAALQAATCDPQRRPLRTGEVDHAEVGVALLGRRRLLVAGEAAGPDEGLMLVDEADRDAFGLPGAADEAALVAAGGLGPVRRREAVAVTVAGRLPGRDPS